MNNDKGRNTFNPTTISALHSAFDDAERLRVKALVTVGTTFYYSTGMDLEWSHTKGRTPEEVRARMKAFYTLAARMYRLPFPTIAAVNGHAYAGGFLLACCHDYIVMLNDPRARLCMNEVVMPGIIGKPLLAILESKLANSMFRPTTAAVGDTDKSTAIPIMTQPHCGRVATALRDTVLHGRKWTPHEAYKAGFVDFVIEPTKRSRSPGDTLPGEETEREALQWIHRSLELNKLQHDGLLDVYRSMRTNA
eukprot:TRINITY_DN55616_c1_g1_i1.p1 TRINITY_DN55616_c1_g1~~TRINITY_DN55616_c1_g1_i1.p1  ORF type:complete len:250 (-),score=28.41 TRINITY_DN55616_c1_g1_i1:382-1131(-)